MDALWMMSGWQREQRQRRPEIVPFQRSCLRCFFLVIIGGLDTSVDTVAIFTFYATLETLQVNKLSYFEYVHLVESAKTGLFTGV